ncbi:MAG TPA: hypothetical protein VII74_06575, partial [Chthoniobacterales bacterium]
MKALLLVLSLALTTTMTAAPNEQKKPFTFEAMMSLKRLAEPVPSPDGKWVLFAATDVNLDENTRKSHLWIVSASGGEARRLNNSPNEEERPRFSPDGKRIIFTFKATDPSQIWSRDFDAATGQLTGTARQITSLSTGADGAIWSPDGKNILFVSSVYPDCKTDACNQERDEALKKSKVKAKLFTHLLFRHWKEFTEFKRSHLFVVSAEGHATPTDITPVDHDVPPFSLGGSDMYTISPDGKEVAYTSNIDEVGATSTNNDIFVVPITGGTPKKISTSPGSDSTPRYSPDGKSIAWLSQAHSGYESDRFTLAIYDRAKQKIRIATEAFDRWVGSFV